LRTRKNLVCSVERMGRPGNASQKVLMRAEYCCVVPEGRDSARGFVHHVCTAAAVVRVSGALLVASKRVRDAGRRMLAMWRQARTAANGPQRAGLGWPPPQLLCVCISLLQTDTCCAGCRVRCNRCSVHLRVPAGGLEARGSTLDVFWGEYMMQLACAALSEPTCQ
jgi:hypothetical protein